MTYGIKAVSSGTNHTCALTTGGAVKCWEYNSTGQIGNGTTLNQTSPVWVSSTTSGIKAIATGDSHSCALTTLGTTKCWGQNTYGQLGTGTLINSVTPAQVTW